MSSDWTWDDQRKDHYYTTISSTGSQTIWAKSQRPASQNQASPPIERETVAPRSRTPFPAGQLQRQSLPGAQGQQGKDTHRIQPTGTVPTSLPLVSQGFPRQVTSLSAGPRNHQHTAVPIVGNTAHPSHALPQTLVSSGQKPKSAIQVQLPDRSVSLSGAGRGQLSPSVSLPYTPTQSIPRAQTSHAQDLQKYSYKDTSIQNPFDPSSVLAQTINSTLEGQPTQFENYPQSAYQTAQATQQIDSYGAYSQNVSQTTSVVSPYLPSIAPGQPLRPSYGQRQSADNSSAQATLSIASVNQAVAPRSHSVQYQRVPVNRDKSSAVPISGYRSANQAPSYVSSPPTSIPRSAYLENTYSIPPPTRTNTSPSQPKSSQGVSHNFQPNSEKHKVALNQAKQPHLVKTKTQDSTRGPRHDSSSKRRQSIGVSSHGNPGSGTLVAAPKHTLRPLPGSNSERLDPAFQQIKYNTPKHFVVGLVFKMFLIENAGETAYRRSLEGSSFTQLPNGEYAFHQYRRLVVVQEVSKQFFCYCCPITTYGGQGTTKKGVDQEAHTMIYSGTKAPAALPGEKGMDKDAIRVELDSPADKLDPRSRINLAKAHIINHNVKILKIGMVDERSLPKLLAYRQDVLNDQRPS